MTLEPLIQYRDDFLVTEKIIPTRRHQAQEEILEFERRFASELYFQKDLERRSY